MAEQTAPRIGLKWGWDLGETEWKTGMDLNLIKLDGIYALSVLDRTLTAPPGSPTNGDLYIVAATATGAWTGYEKYIAYYVSNAWAFYPPKQGWGCRVENESDCFIFYNGTVWSDDQYLPDGGNLVLGTSSGTKIGTAVTQLLSFWNATPIVQPTGAGQAAVIMDNADEDIGGLVISATYSQSEVQGLRDQSEILADDTREINVLVTALRTALVDAGIIKGSA